MTTSRSCALTCPMRRKFLADCVRQATAVSLMAGATTWLAACGSGSGTTPDASEAGPGAAADGSGGGAASPSSAATRFTFVDHPELQTVGGAIMAKVGSTPIAVVRTGATAAVVLNATCPHQGCTVGAYDKTAQTFTCPCHGSVYGEAGDLKQGPSTRALTAYAATVSTTDISAVIA